MPSGRLRRPVMLVHPLTPQRCLFEVSDLSAGVFPAYLARHREAARAVLAWAENYLSRPDPTLGRTGAVCPYVPAALRHGHFYLAICPGRRHDHGTVTAALL